MEFWGFCGSPLAEDLNFNNSSNQFHLDKDSRPDFPPGGPGDTPGGMWVWTSRGSRLAVNWPQPIRADVILMVLIDQECHTSLK